MHRRQRLLTLVVGFIVAIFGLTTVTTAAASDRTDPETRVRDFSSAATTIVAANATVSPAHAGFPRPEPARFVSATGVVTNNGEQLSLFDADDYIAKGIGLRRARWQLAVGPSATGGGCPIPSNWVVDVNAIANT
jgi:hypothetical protein